MRIAPWGSAPELFISDDDRRTELLDLADPLGVQLGVRADDERLAQVVVGDLPLALLVHRLRVVPVVGVELIGLRALPDPRPLEGRVVVLGPGEARLQQDLARLAAGVLGGGPVGVEDLRHRLGIRKRPDPVAPAAGDGRCLRAEGRDVDRRPALGPRVEVGAIGREVLAPRRSGACPRTARGSSPAPPPCARSARRPAATLRPAATRSATRPTRTRGKGRPGNIVSSVAQACAIRTGWYRGPGGVTPVPNGTSSVACPTAPSQTQAWPDSPGSHQG